MSFDTSDMDIFLSDFAITVKATTWGVHTLDAIFDTDYVEYEDVSMEAPFLLVKATDIPTTATTGDLFVVDGTDYKLVDVQYSEPGMKRIILALT